MARVTVLKTYKLFIGGKFPRTESGRSMPIENTRGDETTHLCRASRKDLRNAVEAATKALGGWSTRTAYNRGQILYRMAEMLEARGDELVTAIRETESVTPTAARREVACAVDRLVSFAGWTDKYAQIIGCHNPVAGPYYNFTVPEPTGVIGLVAPNTPSLLGLVSLMAPALAAGNVVVLIASEKHPIPAAVFGEVCATSDVPGGVVNILTGYRKELMEPLASHREVAAISAAGVTKREATTLRLGRADNIKRVHIDGTRDEAWYDDDARTSPWTIEPFVEHKTIWHPAR